MDPVLVLTNERFASLHPATTDRDKPSLTYDDSARKLSEGKAALFGRANVVIEECSRVPTEKELSIAHSRRFIEKFRATCRRVGPGESIPFGTEAAVGPKTFDAAATQYGACLEMIDRLSSHPGPVMVLAAPPTHHAVPRQTQLRTFMSNLLGGSRIGDAISDFFGPVLDSFERTVTRLGGAPRREEQAMGFCFLSGDSAAVLRSIRRGNRTALIDLDHHFCNGPADRLANVKNAFVIDFAYHAPYDRKAKRFLDFRIDPETGNPTNGGREYPYTKWDPSVGVAPFTLRRARNILHIPIQWQRPEDQPTPDQLVEKFRLMALPKLNRFAPQTIILNWGLDSERSDPLGGMGFTAESYFEFMRMLRQEFPNAKFGLILQGGYHWPNYKTCLPAGLLGLQLGLSDNRPAATILAEHGVLDVAGSA